ncbi:MAG: hypothetical protein OEQ74_03565 [Gammaproteobacteria bacterium]|nr:hypothetical protein [Gammaproteobacteria bacterium]
MRLILFVVALALAAPVFADSHNANVADAWLVVVKDGHDEEFEKAFTDHLKHRKRKGDSRAWKTYSPLLGDDLNHYVIRYCCVSYAEMDEYRAWSEKAKMNDHWNENVDPHVASYRHYFYELDVENNNWPEDDPGYTMFGVTQWKVKPGRGGPTSASKKMLSDHAKDGGWPRSWAWSDRVGGKGNVLTIVSPYMNYADMEGPEGGFFGFLAGRVGEEEAGKMLSDFSENFHGSSYTVYRLIEDMSMKE